MNMKSQTLTRVKNLNTDVNGTVVDILSSQFTVEYDDGTFGFLLFKYRNIDWEPIGEARRIRVFERSHRKFRNAYRELANRNEKENKK